MKIGIVGGGLMGLALAYRLSEQGHAVTLMEKDSQLGGLSTYYNFGAFFWDKFYHVILPSDSQLMGFIKLIGLEDQLCWKSTLTGFLVNKQCYSVSNNREFLRFPLIGLIGKIRLGLTMLYCSRIKDWQRLEKVHVEDWLMKTCGRETFENMWKPLLLAKLGEHYKRVSAVFIWSYIKRMFSAREVSAQNKENLGHVVGGYKTVIERVTELIQKHGGKILTRSSVKKITPHPNSGLTIEKDGGFEHFDKVIFTSPVNVLQATVPSTVVNVSSNGQGEVEYLGVICMVLVTRKPIVPYYVLNITDSDLPFTGVIGMSNVVPPDETGQLYVTYLPKYVLSTDPLLRESNESIHALFFEGIKKVFPDLGPEDIESVHINRAFKVQPLQVMNYSKLVPTVETQHRDFFVLNTSQFVNNTLNNNEVIRAVNEFLENYKDQFHPDKSQAGSQALPASA